MKNLLLCVVLLLIFCGCRSRIDHSTPQTLAESYVRAFSAGDYDAMVEAWSPETRKFTRKFALENNIPERDFVKFMFALARNDADKEAAKLANDPLFFQQTVEQLLKDRIVTGKREEGFVNINGKWYLQFF
jgi:uncharacterized protein YchJ